MNIHVKDLKLHKYHLIPYPNSLPHKHFPGLNTVGLTFAKKNFLTARLLNTNCAYWTIYTPRTNKTVYFLVYSWTRPFQSWWSSLPTWILRNISNFVFVFSFVWLLCMSKISHIPYLALFLNLLDTSINI